MSSSSTAQQILNVILAFARRLGGDFLVFPQNGWKLELPQMVREQQLWRRGIFLGDRHHAAALDTSAR